MSEHLTSKQPSISDDACYERLKAQRDRLAVENERLREYIARTAVSGGRQSEPPSALRAGDRVEWRGHLGTVTATGVVRVTLDSGHHHTLPVDQLSVTKSACTCPPGMCCEKSGAAPSEIRQCRDAVETSDDLWTPYANDGMRHMENADVSGGATDQANESRPSPRTVTHIPDSSGLTLPQLEAGKQALYSCSEDPSFDDVRAVIAAVAQSNPTK